MGDETAYNRNFSLPAAYQFLASKGLGEQVQEVRGSADTFMSYDSTLRRAKIVRLLDDKRLMDEFLSSVWPDGKTRKGQGRLSFWRRLYLRFRESEVEENEGGGEGDGEEQEEGLYESQFALETDLRDYLANNLHLIEQGLRLYKGEDGGRPGVEFQIDAAGRRIDILAVDKSGVPVVIELKVRRGHERTIGQVLYYQAMARKRLQAPQVRIVIVAHEISGELRAASETIPGLMLFEYELSMKLSSVPAGVV